ncbi:MAG: cation:proton antiporter, partial [Aphanizomenon sp.]
MNTITLAWIATPFFLGFIIFIVPKLNRHLTLWGTIASAAYGLQLFLNPSPVTLNLLDSFGIKLIADELSAYFILTNAIVTAAVALYCWRSDKTAFFY